jgi:MoaA/NifB/PqqE/SkfB family radical SAM enzyme
MEKTVEELKEELETVSLRLNGIIDEVALKTREGDSLYKRKIDLIEKIDRLESD